MNRDSDDHTARSPVTLRLDRDLLERIDDLAAASGVDRTELVRRLLADGLASRRMELSSGEGIPLRRSRPLVRAAAERLHGTVPEFARG